MSGRRQAFKASGSERECGTCAVVFVFGTELVLPIPLELDSVLAE